MEQYMKATATPFVHHALKDTILKIMESKQSCEVMTNFFSLWKHTAIIVSNIHSYKFELIHFHVCPFSIKLNPSKLEKNEDVNLNLDHLLNILSELVEKIFLAAEILPP